jgi:hypothetical protein
LGLSPFSLQIKSQEEIAGILNVQTDKKEYEYKATAERWPKKEVIVRLSFFYFIRAG